MTKYSKLAIAIILMAVADIIAKYALPEPLFLAVSIIFLVVGLPCVASYAIRGR